MKIALREIMTELSSILVFYDSTDYMKKQKMSTFLCKDNIRKLNLTYGELLKHNGYYVFCNLKPNASNDEMHIVISDLEKLLGYLNVIDARESHYDLVSSYRTKVEEMLEIFKSSKMRYWYDQEPLYLHGRRPPLEYFPSCHENIILMRTLDKYVSYLQKNGMEELAKTYKIAKPYICHELTRKEALFNLTPDSEFTESHRANMIAALLEFFEKDEFFEPTHKNMIKTFLENVLRNFVTKSEGHDTNEMLIRPPTSEYPFPLPSFRM